MVRPLKRAQRWVQCNVRFVRNILRDIGIGNSNSKPLWLSDNPFLARQVRQSARGPALFFHSFMLLIVLTAAMLWGVHLKAEYARMFSIVALRGFHLAPYTFIFALIALTHYLILSYFWLAATARNAQDRRRLRWLSEMLTVPIRRPETVMAETIASSLRRMIVHITVIPLYVYLCVLTGVAWAPLVSLYGLILVTDLIVQAVPWRITNEGASKRGAMALAFALKSVPPASFTRLFPTIVLALFYVVCLLTIPGIGVGQWGWHLFRPVHLGNVYAATTSCVLFPYSVSVLTIEPIQFFRGALSPAWYLAIAIILSKVAGVFETAARWSTVETAEIADPNRLRRAYAITRTTAFWVAFCIIGYAWRSWVLSGDTGTLFGPGHTGQNWNIAGLLLLVGAFIPPMVTMRTLSIQVAGAKGLHRPLSGLFRRALRLLVRCALPVGVLYLVACLCGWAWPFTGPAGVALARILAATAVSATFGAGFGLLIDAVVHRTPHKQHQPRVVVAAYLGIVIVPIAALFSQFPWITHLAFVSPFYAWLKVFPCMSATYAIWKHSAADNQISLQALPSYTQCLMIPLIASFGMGLLASALRRLTPLQSPQAARAQDSPGTKPLPQGFPTLTPSGLPPWILSRTDNPVFLRDLARTLPRPWYGVLSVAGSICVAGMLFTWFLISNGVDIYSSLNLATQSTKHLIGELCLGGAIALAFTQIIVAGIIGYWVGERSLHEDQEHGALGALLITPMNDSEVFLGRTIGRALGIVGAFTTISACTAALAFVFGRDTGTSTAFSLWAVTQMIICTIGLASIGAGVALASPVMRFRWLRGGSVIAAIAAAITAGAALPAILPEQAFDAGKLAVPLAGLAGCTLASLVLSLILTAFGYWRFVLLRKRDIEHGDQPGK